MFSMVFLVHTALLLGQNQLTDYGVDTDAEREACRSELFRTARVLQAADRDGRALPAGVARALERRIEDACYGGES